MDMQSSVRGLGTICAILVSSLAVSTLHILLLIDIGDIHQDVSSALIAPSVKESLIIIALTGDIDHSRTVGVGMNRHREALFKILLVTAAKADNERHQLHVHQYHTPLLKQGDLQRRDVNVMIIMVRNYGNRKADCAGRNRRIKDVGDSGNHIAMETKTNHPTI
jgi:hypothetical protein